MHNHHSQTNQKKASSLSFTQQTLKEQQKSHHRQFRSHEQKKKKQDTKSMEQKASLNKMLTTNVQQRNIQNQNSKKLHSFHWELMGIDQKRTMTGIKVRLKCKHLSLDLYVVIRISFTLQYFKHSGRIQQGNIFIELDEINFIVSIKQRKMFQNDLDKIMKPMLSRPAYIQDEDDKKWVIYLLQGVENIFLDCQFQKKPKRTGQSINRKQTNNKYMLYHSPVAFAWSPRGFFSLTENKIPANKSSFIGNAFSFKTNIQVPRMLQNNTINQQQLSETNQQSIVSIYTWQVQQQIQLLSLGGSRKQLANYYRDSGITRKEDSKKKLLSTNSLSSNLSRQPFTALNSTADTISLESIPKLSSTMKKIYQRHFGMKVEHDTTYRGEKLNVYLVMGENRAYEDEMIYLMEKINNDRYKHVLEVVLSNTLISYSGFFSSSEQFSSRAGIHRTGQLDQARYFVIAQILREEKPKLSSSPFRIQLCLKSIIIENQYHSHLLEHYFRRCFNMLGVSHPSEKHHIYYLGSYMHFDQFKCQKILISLLEHYEYHYELNLKHEKEVRFIIQSKHNEAIKKHIKVKKIVRFPPLKEDWLINDDHRKHFVQILLPILLVRDRNYQEFYYRQLQRIIAANEKIINFYKHLGNVIRKVQEQKHEFIKNMVNQYLQFEEQRRKTELATDVRRQFVVYCQKCHKPSRTFEIAQAKLLKLCSKCQNLSLNKSK